MYFLQHGFPFCKCSRLTMNTLAKLSTSTKQKPEGKLEPLFHLFGDSQKALRTASFKGPA